MGTLLLLLFLRRGDDRRRDDGGEFFLALVLIPVVVTVLAPVIWWAWSRDAGYGRWSSTYHALSIAVLATAGAVYVDWWAAPLTLLVGGLTGLVGIDHNARREVARERAEIEQEERDWRSQRR